MPSSVDNIYLGSSAENLDWLKVGIDSKLEDDLSHNCPDLTSASNTWDMRSIGWKLQTFFGQRGSALGRSLSQEAVTLDDTRNVFALG